LFLTHGILLKREVYLDEFTRGKEPSKVQIVLE
jgi:hypothetical protein